MIEALMEDVTFRFGKTGPIIIENFSLGIKKGDFVYIAGQNGSGKSTILKILCGLISPQKGSVMILDKNPLKNHEVIKQAGVLVDGMGFYSDLSLRENIILFAKEKYGNGGIEEALKKYIKLWDIDFNTLYKRSSHGMRKIAQLTLSLLGEPQVLVWDEPEVALDEKRYAILIDIIKDYKSKEKTIIMAGTVPTRYETLINKTVYKEVIL